MPKCMVLFGLDRAREVQRLIEDATGEPCPCARELPCPLLPVPESGV